MHHHSDDPLLRTLWNIIRLAVRILAVLMTLLILWGVADVVWVAYQRLISPPFMLVTISDILQIFGAFMAVMIAIEIYENLMVYLKDELINVEIVLATALMAVARKVIVLDYEKTSYPYVWSTAGLVLALGIAYWLIVQRRREREAIGGAHGELAFRQVFFEPQGRVRLQPLNLQHGAEYCARDEILGMWRLVAHVSSY